MNGASNILTKGRTMVLLAIVTAFGGCLGGPAQQDHFYRFELPEPDTRFDPPPLNGTLLVARPWADALTGERHLLYRQNRGSSQLYRHAYHRWVDTPTLLLQNEIARYLRDSNLADQVVTPELRAKGDYWLSCRIAKFERVLDGSSRVVMELELGVTRMKDRQALFLKTYGEEHMANSNGVAASVEAYNQVLSNILNQFMADAAGLAHARMGSANP